MREGWAAGRVGERLKALREARGLSLRQLGVRAGLGAEVVSRAERGVHSPSVATLERLCGGLAVSLAEFFSEKAVGAGARGGAERATAEVAMVEALLSPLEPPARVLVLQGLHALARGFARYTQAEAALVPRAASRPPAFDSERRSARQQGAPGRARKGKRPR